MRALLSMAREAAAKPSFPRIGGRPGPMNTTSSAINSSTRSRSPAAVASIQVATSERMACSSRSIDAPPRLRPGPSPAAHLGAGARTLGRLVERVQQNLGGGVGAAGIRRLFRLRLREQLVEVRLPFPGEEIFVLDES